MVYYGSVLSLEVVSHPKLSKQPTRILINPMDLIKCNWPSQLNKSKTFGWPYPVGILFQSLVSVKWLFWPKVQMRWNSQVIWPFGTQQLTRLPETTLEGTNPTGHFLDRWSAMTQHSNLLVGLKTLVIQQLFANLASKRNFARISIIQ